MAPHRNPSQSQHGAHVVACHSTQVNTLRLSPSQPDRPVLDLPTPEGWKAELTMVVGYITNWFACLRPVTEPTSVSKKNVNL